MNAATRALLDAPTITVDLWQRARPWAWSGGLSPDHIELRCPQGRSTVRISRVEGQGGRGHPFCDPAREEVLAAVLADGRRVSPLMLLEETLPPGTGERGEWWPGALHGVSPHGAWSLAAVALAAAWCRRTRAASVRGALADAAALTGSRDDVMGGVSGIASRLGLRGSKVDAAAEAFAACRRALTLEDAIGALVTAPALRGYPAEAVLLVGARRDAWPSDPYLAAYRRWMLADRMRGTR